MKITDVRLEMFKRARDVPITNGLYTYTHILLNIVVIETDDPDVSGIGLAGGGENRPEVGTAIINHLKKMLGGQPTKFQLYGHTRSIPTPSTLPGPGVHRGGRRVQSQRRR